MPALVGVRSQGGEVLFEGEFSRAALEEIAIDNRVADVVRSTTTSVSTVAETIRRCAAELVGAFDRMPSHPRVVLREATVELGVSISGEGNVFVVKGSAEANLTVTLTWTLA